MKSDTKVVAYIDGANLHKGVSALGWKLHYPLFRQWLEQKFGVTTSYLFMGMIASNKDLYSSLSKAGFVLIFKEVIFDKNGKAKGNCDTNLIVQAARDIYENNVTSVVLVSSDGDYEPLVRLWVEKGIVCHVVAPSGPDKCSVLLKRTGVPILCLDSMQNKLSLPKMKKPPEGNASHQGSLS